MESAIGEFLSYLVAERGSSPLTVSAYRHDLELYRHYLEDAHPEILPADAPALLDAIDRQIVVGFEHFLVVERGYAPSSVSRILAALKSFHSFLMREGVCESNPAQMVSIPKKPQRLPDVLSIEAVCDLIEGVSGQSPRDLRDRAILEVLYGCGLRVSELCGLDCDRVNLEEGFILVVGKGSKERVVPISGEAHRALSAYLCKGRSALSMKARASTRAVFLNARGGRISRQSVFRMVQKRGLECGIRVPPICSRAVPICVSSRICWAIRISRRPRSTRMCSGRISARNTCPPTPALAENAPERAHRFSGVHFKDPNEQTQGES